MNSIHLTPNQVLVLIMICILIGVVVGFCLGTFDRRDYMTEYLHCMQQMKGQFP